MNEEDDPRHLASHPAVLIFRILIEQQVLFEDQIMLP